MLSVANDSGPTGRSKKKNAMGPLLKESLPMGANAMEDGIELFDPDTDASEPYKGVF